MRAAVTTLHRFGTSGDAARGGVQALGHLLGTTRPTGARQAPRARFLVFLFLQFILDRLHCQTYELC